MCACRQIRAAKIGCDRQARPLQPFIPGENVGLRLPAAEVPKLLKRGLTIDNWNACGEANRGVAALRSSVQKYAMDYKLYAVQSAKLVSGETCSRQ